jgi:hypothetical protein
VCCVVARVNVSGCVALVVVVEACVNVCSCSKGTLEFKLFVSLKPYEIYDLIRMIWCSPLSSAQLSLSTFNFQLSTFNFQLSTFNFQLLTFIKLSTFNF